MSNDDRETTEQMAMRKSALGNRSDSFAMARPGHQVSGFDGRCSYCVRGVHSLCVKPCVCGPCRAK